MKNVIEVIRLNDNKTRLYELPETMNEEIKAGRLVDVDFRGEGSTTLALVKVGNRLIDEEIETMIREYRHIKGEFAKVRRVYPEPVAVEWPTDEDQIADHAEDDEETETDDE